MMASPNAFDEFLAKVVLLKMEDGRSEEGEVLNLTDVLTRLASMHSRHSTGDKVLTN